MSRVIVGVDPHKKSVTIEAVDEHGSVLARGRYGTDTAGYRAMLKQVRDRWPQHRWAVEGAQGVGRPLAQRLLAQGEVVVDVPAKLAARVRVFDTRQRPQDRRHRRACSGDGRAADRRAARARVR
jgi:transposase